MKKLILLALFATASAISASAAYTAGFEAGYLTDNDDAYWAVRGGWEFKSGGNLSHQLELELGRTGHSDGITYTPYTGRIKLMPLTVNYRAETTRADKLGFYFGAGLGQTRASINIRGGAPNASDRDHTFAAQAFAGLSFKATPALTLHAGAKYLWIDTVELLGLAAEVGNDLALTAGASFRF